MSVNPGQRVSAAVTNAAFVSKTTDSTSVAKLTLNKAAEGAQVESVQKAINKIYEGLGTTGQNDTAINDYASNNFITNGQDRKEAIEALDAQVGLNTTDIANHEARLDTIETGTLTISGNKTFSGDVVISGSFTTTGPTNTSSNTDITDVNITLNKSGNDASSEGAGITIDRTGTKGSIVYENALASKFKIGDLGSEQQVVTTGHTQTLTNKTTTDLVQTASEVFTEITTPSNPASGFRKVYAKSDGIYELDSTGLEKKIGTGSGGGGGVNLITNGSADDANASIFVTYKDSVNTIPDDGTGVGASLTTSITSTNPLVGTKSFLLTKPAANNQGEGWAIPFTVDIGYRAKSLKISADYIVNSGTFVAGSLTSNSSVTWFIYDVTNSALIHPSNIKMFSNSSTVSDKFEATFQTSATGSSYRLIAHVNNTSTNSFELMVDNITVSTQTYVYGTPVTDWVSYTPIITGFGTVTNNVAYTRIVGDSREFKGRFTAGTSTATVARIGLISTESIDTNKINVSQAATLGIITKASGANTSFPVTTVGPWIITNDNNNPTSVSIAATTATGSNHYPLVNGNGISASGDSLSYEFSVPILGRSSSVQVSDSADTRVYGVKAGLTVSNQTGINPNNTAVKINLQGAVGTTDTHASFNSGSSRIDIKTAGFYQINGNIQISGTNVLNNLYIPYLYVNGVFRSQGASAYPVVNGAFTVIISDLQYLNSGDFVELYLFGQGNNSASTLTAVASSLGSLNFLSVVKASGPSAIAASDSVNAKYSNTAGTSVGTGAQTLTFPTKVFDSHGFFTSNTTYTPSIAGKYLINLKFTSNTTAGTSTNLLRILVNGSTVSEVGAAMAYVTAATFTWQLNDSINVVSGDAITFQFNNGFGTAVNSTTTAGQNSVSIIRVGN